MLSHFFIDRPIFSVVIALVISIAGLVAMVNLPIAQFPQITPIQIQVTATYPGANGTLVAQNVGAPIEQKVNSANIRGTSRAPLGRRLRALLHRAAGAGAALSAGAGPDRNPRTASRVLGRHLPRHRRRLGERSRQARAAAGSWHRLVRADASPGTACLASCGTTSLTLHRKAISAPSPPGSRRG